VEPATGPISTAPTRLFLALALLRSWRSGTDLLHDRPEPLFGFVAAEFAGGSSGYRDNADIPPLPHSPLGGSDGWF